MDTSWKYEPRRANPEDVREDLMRVWGNNLPVEDAEEKYNWFYRDAPIPPEVAFVLVASREGEPAKIVGVASVGIREYSVRGKTIRTALLADLAVDAEHRTVMPAMMLVRMAHFYCLQEHEMLYGFPNEQAVQVFLRAGYQKLGNMPRYARVLRHAGYIDRLSEYEQVPGWSRPIIATSTAQSVLGAAADAVRLAQIAPSLAYLRPKYQLEWLKLPDPRIDALWEAAHQHYTVVGRRSSEFLAWRFPEEEGNRVVAIESRESGYIRAYAVVRFEDQVAHIRDFFGFPDDIAPLLLRLVPTLYAKGATSMSVRYLGDPRFVTILEDCGFVEREGSRDIIVDSVPGLDVDNVEDWFLGDIDEDV